MSVRRVPHRRMSLALMGLLLTSPLHGSGCYSWRTRPDLDAVPHQDLRRSRITLDSGRHIRLIGVTITADSIIGFDPPTSSRMAFSRASVQRLEIEKFDEGTTGLIVIVAASGVLALVIAFVTLDCYIDCM